VIDSAIRAERAQKHARVARYLEDHGLDCVVLARRCNFSWYTSGARNFVSTACEVGNSFLVVRPGGAVLVANNIEARRLCAEELPDVETVTFAYESAGPAKALQEVVGSSRAAADAPVGIGASPLAADFDRLRWVLGPAEVLRYRAVCNDALSAMETVARQAPRGASEHELAAELSAALLRRGLLPWVLLVAADERLEAFRHPLPTAQRAQRRFMLVAGAERHGLVAAYSRLVSFEDLSPELARRQQACATVDAALLSATVPGATLGEIFDCAQRAYASVGFADEWRLHHQGGSCGYQPREVKASPGDRTPVLADQAFAWNPSITGAKSEDTVLCRAGGVEMLASPTDWPAVTAQWQGRSYARPAILVR
jgi:antitoxin VapB